MISQPGSDAVRSTGPKVVVFPVTYRCNARCVMCSIGGMKWSDRPASFFEPFFASPRTDGLESINITGGEPTLRSDLAELVAMIVRHKRQLREILISTNGLRPTTVADRIEAVLKVVPPHIKVWAFVSLDSLDNTADQVRGFDNAGALARKAIELLQGLQRYENFKVAISCTITRLNCHNLEEMLAYARSAGIYIDFPYATVNTTYINSAPKASQFVTTPEQDRRIAEFYGALSREPQSAAALLYYRRMEKFLSTGELDHGDCVYRSDTGLLLEPDGKLRVCGMSGDSLIGDMAVDDVDEVLDRARPSMWKHCATCTTNSYGGWAKDAQRLAKELTLARVRETRATVLASAMH